MKKQHNQRKLMKFIVDSYFAESNENIFLFFIFYLSDYLKFVLFFYDQQNNGIIVCLNVCKSIHLFSHAFASVNIFSVLENNYELGKIKVWYDMEMLRNQFIILF